MSALDITGMRFGRLVAIRRVDNIGKKTAWECVCDCGKHTVTKTDYLRHGKTQSCGCLWLEKTRNRLLTHGDTKSKLYGVYRTMLSRCYTKSQNGYERYGGRGIAVDDVWRGESGYVNFREWAVANGYKEGLTIDRIDVNGNYCPKNCRWVTPYAQSRNKSNNVLITIDGRTMVKSDWAKERGIDRRTIDTRLSRGWPIEEALGFVERKRDRVASGRKRHDAAYITINGERRLLIECAEEYGIKPSTIRARIKSGWSHEDALFTPVGGVRASERIDSR